MSASPTRGPRAIRRLPVPLGLLLAAAVLALAIALSSAYWATQRRVTITINGVVYTHRTHQSTTAGVLRELGIDVQPPDVLTAPSVAELRSGAPIVLQVARRVQVVHDGALSRASGHYASVGEALAALDMAAQPHDRLTLGNTPCTPATPLPQPNAGQSVSATRWLAELRRPVAVALERAIAISVREGELSTTLYTTAGNVGEALFEHDVLLYEGDRVQPELAASLSPGLVVRIERARPLTLSVGGVGRLLRTRMETVRDLLQAYAVSLGPKDYVLPDPRSAIARDMRVQVVRVEDAYYIEEVPIPYEVRYEPDPEMDIDLSDVAAWGVEGAHRRRMRVHYEDGREIYRVEEEEWIAREARDRIISYGTRIVLRELETPDGTITYWRHLRMLATSYNAATAGTPLTASWYGYTRLGEKARKGIIAVDPQVIALRQGMYVPGYGAGYAGDTGSAIKGRRIDLCYDDHNLVLWRTWVDVYLLAPAPPTDSILWIVPNSPAERG